MENTGRAPARNKAGELPARHFDLALTLGSGQAFHWIEGRGGFVGAIGGRAVRLEQTGDRVRFEGAPGEAVARYLALDHPVAAMWRTFPRTARMRASLRAFGGMRILRQPPWEALATFLTATVKKVEHIRGMSLLLRERFGELLRVAGERVHAYPTPAALRDAGERALRDCGLGFRAPRLHRLACRVASGEIDLDAWAALDDAELARRLTGIDGVGVKVADCVMLFGFGRLAAFPVDVWIARVLRWEFGEELPARALRALAAERFGPFGGYAQQILFHAARTGLIGGDGSDEL